MSDSPYRVEEVVIPTSVAFEILEKLRLVGVYLDPPEDFKPWKWPSPEDYYAEEIRPAHRALFECIADALGCCKTCGGKLPCNYCKEKETT